MSVQNKRVVVTGGSRGIGAEMIKALAQAGAYVASLDVLDEPGRQVAAASGGKATYHHCDISNRAEVDAAFDAAASAMGGIDGLVNAAGIERHVNPQDITDADWERMMAINVTGTFLTNQAAFRHMRDAWWPHSQFRLRCRAGRLFRVPRIIRRAKVRSSPGRAASPPSGAGMASP